MSPIPPLRCILLAALPLAPLTLRSQEQAPAADPLATADGVVDALYAAVTIDAGAAPDWDHVRSLFLEEAVVVLRTARDRTRVFTREGFVQDFVGFLAEPRMQGRAFVERIVRRESLVFGDIAHVLVLYEAGIPGSGRPAQQGVDSIQLVRQGERWKIASILNELPLEGRPLPRSLRGEGS